MHGHIRVVESSDLMHKMQTEFEDENDLLYCIGNFAIYVVDGICNFNLKTNLNLNNLSNIERDSINNNTSQLTLLTYP